MRLTKGVVTIVLGVFISSSLAASPGIPTRDAKDCMEGPLAQFGRYIGNWSIEDSSLSPQTGQWEAGKGAQWNFVCLGGMSIQDFWLPADGRVGTNLRTWNEEKGTWDIAWAVTGAPGFTHITAQQDDAGNIVMRYVSPKPDPDRRITFFPPDESGWKWKLEITQDGGENWLEVYRISATPSGTSGQ